MNATRYQNGEAIRLETEPLVNGAGTPQTGLATVTVRVRRASDGFWLDWADGVFKAAGWTTLDGAMAEVDATRDAGVYFRSFPTAGYADDKYSARMTSSTPTIANVPQLAAAIVGDWVDNLNATVSSRAVPGDAMDLVAGAVDAAAVAADAVGEIADGVWDEAIAGHSGAGSAGLELQGKAEPGDAMDLIAGAVDAAAIATDAIDGDAIAPSAVTEIQAGLATGAAVAAVQASVDAIRNSQIVASGTATGVPTATVIDTTISKPNSFFRGMILQVIDGTNSAVRQIHDYANASGRFTLDVGDPLPFTPTAGATVLVHAVHDGRF